jgi:hypothetical protein
MAKLLVIELIADCVILASITATGLANQRLIAERKGLNDKTAPDNRQVPTFFHPVALRKSGNRPRRMTLRKDVSRRILNLTG